MATVVDCSNYYESSHESVKLTLLKTQNIYETTNLLLANESSREIIPINFLNKEESSLDDIDMDFESSIEIEQSTSEYIKNFDSCSSSSSESSEKQATNCDYNNGYYEYEDSQQIITNIAKTSTRVIQSPYTPNIDSES